MTTGPMFGPFRGREFPREPYPATSLVAAVLLGGAMMLFLAFFGLVGVFLGGSPFLSRLIFAALAALAVAMPLVGIRALFGSHRYSVITLTAMGVLLFMGGWFAEPLSGAGLVQFAVGPALLVLGVAAFAWWRWATKSRHIDWTVGN